MTEHELQKQILDYLNCQKGYYWRQNTGASVYQDKHGNKRFVRYGKKGISDILGVYYNSSKDCGQFVAIECKVGKNKTSNDQQEFIDAINYFGGIGIVAYSLDDVIKRFREEKLSTT